MLISVRSYPFLRHFFGFSGIQDGNNSDPRWKKVGSGIRIRDKDPGFGSGIRIRNKHPGSATLLKNLEFKVKKPKIPTKYPHVSPFSANFM